MKNSRPQRGQQILQIPIKLSIHLWDLLEQVRIMEVSRGSCCYRLWLRFCLALPRPSSPTGCILSWTAGVAGPWSSRGSYRTTCDRNFTQQQTDHGLDLVSDFLSRADLG